MVAHELGQPNSTYRGRQKEEANLNILAEHFCFNARLFHVYFKKGAFRDHTTKHG